MTGGVDGDELISITASVGIKSVRRTRVQSSHCLLEKNTSLQRDLGVDLLGRGEDSIRLERHPN